MGNYLKQNWVLLLIILVSVSLLYSKCENEKRLSDNIESLGSELNTYKLKSGKAVVSSKTTTSEKVPEKTELTKQFQKVKTIIKIVERLRIDTVTVTYHDSIPCNFERKGAIITSDYLIDYKSNQKGITFSNLVIKDSLEIVTGIKRSWFLGKETQTIDIIHSNKYIITDKIEHLEIKPKNKFYQTTLFKIGIGIIGGALLIK